MLFDASIEGGKLKIEHATKWKRFLATFKEGAKLSLDLEKKKHRRSISQDRYYWLYLSVIGDETGDTANDLHEFFKRKFLRPLTKKILGREITLPASTTDLTKADFSDYLDRIAALTGVPLPDPEAAGYTPNYKTVKERKDEPKREYPDGPTETAFDE